MALLLKCLLYKHEDLRSIPRTHTKELGLNVSLGFGGACLYLSPREAETGEFLGFPG